MNRECELYDRTCTDCGECEKCDYDNKKTCDNCGRCISESGSFRTVNVNEFIKKYEKKDKKSLE